MTVKWHWQNETVLSGMTLKENNIGESNNMGLHVSNTPDVVVNNRKRLAEMLDLPLSQFVCAEQTHSDHFYEVTKADLGRGTETMRDAIKDTDALFTFEKDIVLCSFTADCVPITFYDETTGLVGAIHSGWQGTIKEITKKLFQYLIDEKDIEPEHLHVHLGACISQKKFEVDEDVMVKFQALGYAEDLIEYHAETDKYHINNQAVVKAQCLALGIPEEQIEADKTCTFIAEDYFSHRQDKGTGRHLTFITRRV